MHSNGKRVQQIKIIYNFIGEFDFPQLNQPITVAKGFNEKNRVTHSITRLNQQVLY